MTMRLYDRSSRTLAYADLDPVLRQAVERHAEERLLGAVAPVAVVDTRSISLKRRGLFRRGEPEHRTVGLLLPHALIVLTSGAERGVVVKSTRLADIAAIRRQDPQLVLDTGFSVEARWDGARAVSWFLALGDDPAGRAFHETLHDAVVAARQRG
ncbi:hypothetical protein ACQP1P_26805 [Dactylosporangium sp. CA-052675]|uniref:hypothetical protein n=1 Tax=Dactylosporangium sp. CA-052675 TaxID=3239927 RepID=UPI003D936194